VPSPLCICLHPFNYISKFMAGSGSGALRELLRTEAGQDDTTAAIHTLLHGTHGQNRGLEAVPARPAAQQAKMMRAQQAMPGTAQVASAAQPVAAQQQAQAAAPAHARPEAAPLVSHQELTREQIQEYFKVRPAFSQLHARCLLRLIVSGRGG
jgi:hypothetical protein